MSNGGDSLRVTLVQAALAWHDAGANRRQFAALLAPLAGETDLIVLPEMFTTGFTMQAAGVAETTDGPSVAWLRAQAQALDAAVAGSVITAVEGRHVNRLWWAQPDGALHCYDKRHLFRMGGEHEAFASGERTLVVSWRGFAVAPLICYDLRFPVWSRRRPGYEYDLLLYVANWPQPRIYAWTQLLRARAIENLAYVVGVNRVGPDGHGVPHVGASGAYDFLGRPLVELGAEPRVETVTLDRRALQDFRARFPAYLDADRFTLTP